MNTRAPSAAARSAVAAPIPVEPVMSTARPSRRPIRPPSSRTARAVARIGDEEAHDAAAQCPADGGRLGRPDGDGDDPRRRPQGLDVDGHGSLRRAPARRTVRPRRRDGRRGRRRPRRPASRVDLGRAQDAAARGGTRTARRPSPWASPRCPTMARVRCGDSARTCAAPPARRSSASRTAGSATNAGAIERLVRPAQAIGQGPGQRAGSSSRSSRRELPASCTTSMLGSRSGPGSRGRPRPCVEPQAMPMTSAGPMRPSMTAPASRATGPSASAPRRRRRRRTGPARTAPPWPSRARGPRPARRGTRCGRSPSARAPSMSRATRKREMPRCAAISTLDIWRSKNRRATWLARSGGIEARLVATAPHRRPMHI